MSVAFFVILDPIKYQKRRYAFAGLMATRKKTGFLTMSGVDMRHRHGWIFARQIVSYAATD